MGKETFMERQRFMDSWIGKIVAGIAFVILMILLLKAIQTPTWAMSVPVFCTALVLYMMVGATLYTKIDQRGVHYQFKPFHRRTRTIPWDNIRGSVVRRYSPLREYGGWGIRFSASGLA
ncbi:MAG: hypothetical protein KTR24_12380, partial [Saprospiraceae bacterium]|nr:hypothetical protein [Saprospiraceae bacterium]